MTKILIAFLICATFLFSQSFEEWQKSQLKEYTTYKKTMDDEFAAMLKEKWTIFDSREEKKVYVKPKQKKMPVIKALEIIKKELGFNNKIIFKNKKDVGHYINSPENFKIKKAKKILFKNDIPFKLGIREIIQKKLK